MSQRNEHTESKEKFSLKSHARILSSLKASEKLRASPNLLECKTTKTGKFKRKSLKKYFFTKLAIKTQILHCFWTQSPGWQVQTEHRN